MPLAVWSASAPTGRRDLRMAARAPALSASSAPRSCALWRLATASNQRVCVVINGAACSSMQGKAFCF